MPMMISPFTSFCRAVRAAEAVAVLAVGCLIGGPAWADRADRAQPLNFAADAARVDETKRVNLLTGNVEITKGSMVVRADRVEVRQNADGTQTATALYGAGGRAYFRQKREGVDESIEGEAEKITYEGRTDTVHFSGRAVMRRLRSGVVSDEVAGPSILYDNGTSVFQVVGSGSTQSGASKGRVRGVITPRPAETGASSAGAREAKDKTPVLAPSGTLSKPALEGAR